MASTEFTNPSASTLIPSPTKTKIRPTKPLPTERIAFNRQLEILRAYAAANAPTGQAVSNETVAEIVKLNASTVSLGNSFFVAIGLLQKADTGYLPSPDVIEFNRAYAWSQETAAFKLAGTIEKSWFAQALFPKLNFRPVDIDEALATLADAASAGPDSKDQLRMLLNYLEAVGLTIRDGNTIRLSPQGSGASTPSSTSSSSTTSSSSISERVPLQDRVDAQAIRAPSQPQAGVVQFQINVEVKMDEFAGWPADRITAFFNGIAQVLAARGSGEVVK